MNIYASMDIFFTFLQEILLGDIKLIEQAKNPSAIDATRNPYVFEIHLVNSLVYYIGEDHTWGGKG